MKELSYAEYSDALHDDLVQGSIHGNRIPFEGQLELTRGCNLKCRHCYIGDARWTRDPSELTTLEFKGLFDLLAERGTLWLCMTGGEPLARKDFAELWEYAKAKGFILTLFTNGTLITPEIARLLYRLPAFSVEISLYGATARVYERVTGIPGSFINCMKGIENLRSAQVPFKLKTMLIRENLEEIDEIRRLAEKWGVQFRTDASVNASIGHGKTGGKAPCLCRVENQLALNEETRAPHLLQEMQSLVAHNGMEGLGQQLYSCGAGRNSFYVTGTGRVQMCILTPHRGFELRDGKTFSEAFDRGWKSFEKIRETNRHPDSKCLECKYGTVCESCPGYAYLETGDEDSAVPYLCERAQLRANRLKEASHEHV